MNIIPFQSYQTRSITFLAVNSSFSTVWAASQRFYHDIVRTTFTYVVTHILYPQSPSASEMAWVCDAWSRDRQMVIRSKKFFFALNFFLNATFFKWIKKVLQSIFSLREMLRLLVSRSNSIISIVLSTFSTMVLPERVVSLTSKTPHRNWQHQNCT